MRENVWPHFLYVVGLLTVAGCAPGPRTAELPGDASMPEFPRTPPPASGRCEIPRHLLLQSEEEQPTLWEVESRIVSALYAAGHTERSYYAIEGTLDGFVLVTRLEQTKPDGTPKTGPDRWAKEVLPLRDFSLRAYLEALFKGNEGYFRVIVFIVTPCEGRSESVAPGGAKL